MNFNNVFKDKRVVITGHTGFKGSWLTLWLLNLGAKVYGISKDIPTNPSMFQELGLEGKMEHHIADVTDINSVRAICEKARPDFIFHLAAQPIVSYSYAEPIETIQTNVMGTANVLEVHKMLEHPCVGIIITSDKCYDNVEWIWGYKETDHMGGKDIYSGSKGAAELIFKSYYHSFFKKSDKHKIVSARAGNVIGGGDWALDRIVPDCMRAWHKGSHVEIRSPNATRPWQHVLEPLSGYLALAQQVFENNTPLTGESFNFGPPAEHTHSVKDLLDSLSVHWRKNQSFEPYRVVNEIKFHEAGLLKLNCDKALFYLKWLPVLNYQALIKFTSQWYYNYYEEKNPDMYGFTIAQIDDYCNLAKEKGLKWVQ